VLSGISPGGGVSVPAAAGAAPGAVAPEAVPAEAVPAAVPDGDVPDGEVPDGEVPDGEVAAGRVTEGEPDEHATAAPAVRRRTAGAMSRRDDVPAGAAVSISQKLLNA
jgi:hypothetical protein